MELRELTADLYDFAPLSDVGPRERLGFWYSGEELERPTGP
jgi:hypothetical protein